MKTYTRRDVMRLTGATNSHLTYWTKRGIVLASGGDSPGTGHHRQHRFADLVDAQLAFYLTRIGVPSSEILYAISLLRLATTGERAPHFTDLDARRKAARGEIRREFDKIVEGFEAAFRPYAAAWREFLDPKTRNNISQIGFIWVPNDVPVGSIAAFELGSWMRLLVRAGEAAQLSADVVHVVINVGLLVTHMESATGDSYDLSRIASAEDKR